MNDAAFMRVLNRVCNRANQLHPLLHRAVIRAAVYSKWNAVDVFHHEPWRTVSQRAGIVKARDGWMNQLREQALLGREPAAPFGREPAIAKNLDGHLVP